MGQRAGLRVGAPGQHVGLDRVAQRPVVAGVAGLSEKVGDAQGPVCGDPAEDLGEGEVVSVCPELPDARVEAAPVVGDVPDERPHDRPELFLIVQGLAKDPEALVDHVHHDAVHVVLLLFVSCVAHSYGAGARVPAEPVQFALREDLLPVNAVHDLDLLVLERHQRQDKLQEALGHVVVAEFGQYGDGHGGVANPAEAVVPVADVPDGLGQARRRGREDRAGLLVGQELEHQGAALDGLAVV